MINQWVSQPKGKNREEIAGTHYSSPPIICMVLQVPGQYPALWNVQIFNSYRYRSSAMYCRYIAHIFLLRCLEFIGYKYSVNSICVFGSFLGRSWWTDCSLTISVSVILGDCCQSRYTHVMPFALVWGFGVNSLSPCRKVWKRFTVNPKHYQFPWMC